jgi:hypothetical protein
MQASRSIIKAQCVIYAGCEGLTTLSSKSIGHGISFSELFLYFIGLIRRMVFNRCCAFAEGWQSLNVANLQPLARGNNAYHQS